MDAVEKYRRASQAVREAKVLVVTAGAGMGVDSGLPDFRGDRGFWNAYPMYERLGIDFMSAANPRHFAADPAFGWGFYGHRLKLYRSTVPHDGFGIIRDWCERYGLACFVVTSNVDGQFQKAGFPEDSICEIHGSIHHLQCAGPCCDAVWENGEEVPVDLRTMRAQRIPLCPRCGMVARPNILMFGDFGWISHRTNDQDRRFDDFLSEHLGKPTVVVEMGAGTAIPIRMLSERLGSRPRTMVLRINPREPAIDAPHASLPAGALQGLASMEKWLAEGDFPDDKP